MASDGQDLLRRHSVKLVACNHATNCGSRRDVVGTNVLSDGDGDSHRIAPGDVANCDENGITGRGLSGVCRPKHTANLGPHREVVSRPKSPVDPNLKCFEAGRADSLANCYLPGGVGCRNGQTACQNVGYVRSDVNIAGDERPLGSVETHLQIATDRECTGAIEGRPNNVARSSDSVADRTNSVVRDLSGTVGDADSLMAKPVENVQFSSTALSRAAYENFAHIIMADELRVEELKGAPRAENVTDKNDVVMHDSPHSTAEFDDRKGDEWVVGNHVIGTFEEVEKDYVHIINDDPAKMPPLSAENSTNITATLFLCRHVIIRPFLFILRVIAWHPFSLRFPLAFTIEIPVHGLRDGGCCAMASCAC